MIAKSIRKLFLNSSAIFMIAAVFFSLSIASGYTADNQQDQVRFRVFKLSQPVPAIYGGIFAHDLNHDAKMDFIITSDGHIGAYSNFGKKLWVNKDKIELFPFSHHPSAIAGDLDGDGKEEAAYLVNTNEIKIVDGVTGKTKKIIKTSGKPTAMAIANLRGLGDRDIILQYSQTQLKAIKAEDGNLLWETDEYRGIEHSPVRQADLDDDGFDEAAGAVIIDHDGSRMSEWDLGKAYKGMDSMVIADFVPGYPLEIVFAEQRGANSHTDAVNHEKIIFRALNPWNWEDPNKVAVGNFDPDREGLEIFNRSSGGDGTAKRGREEQYDNEQAPWVLDAEGKLISKYYINDKKPDWWTFSSIEEICRIDWDGDGIDEIAAKERHKNGAGAIIDPITGDFKVILKAKAVRIYAADVLGDQREEAITISENGLVNIFYNKAPRTKLLKPRYWDMQHYKRQKQNWDYYSP